LDSTKARARWTVCLVGARAPPIRPGSGGWSACPRRLLSEPPDHEANRPRSQGAISPRS